MNTEKKIDVLNALIIINNARIKRYKTASSGTDESFLKKTFKSFQNTSHLCKTQLRKEIIKLGGNPVEEKNIRDLFYNFWLKVSKMIKSKETNDIIYSCERNKNIIKQAYYQTIYNNLIYLTN